MTRSIKIHVLAIISLLVLQSCEEGCTDTDALNEDFDAYKDDGSCEYTQATFYAKWSSFQGVPITQVDVAVEGSNIGTITTVYPQGPGNCSATGTVTYQFETGGSVDWNATMFLANGAVLYQSGSVSSSSFTECKKINVTQ